MLYPKVVLVFRLHLLAIKDNVRVVISLLRMNNKRLVIFIDLIPVVILDVVRKGIKGF